MDRDAAGGPLTLLQIGIGIVVSAFARWRCTAGAGSLISAYRGCGRLVSATLLGFASHSPGGLGVFDAAMLVGLWQMDAGSLAACCVRLL